MTYGEWSARWWQWLFSVPKDHNPAFDSDGSNAWINQHYLPVFFLCQTYEEAGIFPNRTIHIPKNSLILIPIINWISILHHDGDNDKELLERAKERMDVVKNLQIAIGETTVREGLDRHRALSPFFDVTLPNDNILGLPPGVRRAISDGYWIFLEPQSKEINITSFGSCSSGATKIGVSYSISLI
ncbi:MAG: hypothetical protein WA941_18485 [Nitrososphaeraceae archaeon]